MQSAIDHMLGLVQEYIDDKKTRSALKANFGYQYSQNLAKMRSEDPVFAEAMGHYLLDTGINVGGHLSDGAFKALIRLRYSQLLDTRWEDTYEEYL